MFKKKKILILPSSMRLEFFGKLSSILNINNEVFKLSGEKKDLDTYEKLDKGEIYFPSRKNLFNMKNKNLKNSNKLIQKIQVNQSMSLNRILLSNERDIGVHYTNNYYYSSKDNFFKSQKNNKRLSEIISLGVEFVSDFLSRESFNLILSGNNSSFYHFLISVISKEKLIPFFVSRRSKILAGQFYWTDNHLMKNESLINYYKNIKSKKISNQARKFIKTYRNEPKTVSFVSKNWKNKEKFYTNNLKTFINIIINNGLSIFFKKYSKARFFKRFYEFLIIALRRNNFSHYISFNKEKLKIKKYIYFPLHKEPELAQNFQEPHINNQFELVKLLSLFTPHGYKLFVKEHRLNHGRRNKSFLNKIKNLHNVEFINPFESQFNYIKYADLIITENGSTGWEGMILKTPVLNLCDAFYSPIIKNKVTNHSKIDKFILDSLENKRRPSDIEIANLYEAEKKCCFDEDKIGITKSLENLLKTKVLF